MVVRQSLWKTLQKADRTAGCTLATVLDGPAANAQLLLCGGLPVWQNGAAALMQKNLTTLQSCTATGIVELDGQRVFTERFGAVPQLVVCGGGHVAAAVVTFAKLLGLPVTAMDDREEYAAQLRAAGADPVLCAPFAQALLTSVHGSSETYFVVVTRAHAFDVDCLQLILQKPAAYVGMMGSRGRAALVRRQLLEAGLDAERVEALHGPHWPCHWFPDRRRDCTVHSGTDRTDQKFPSADRGLSTEHSGRNGQIGSTADTCRAGNRHCTARLYAAGCWHQNAAFTGWSGCWQCGRRYYGISRFADRTHNAKWERSCHAVPAAFG